MSDGEFCADVLNKVFVWVPSIFGEKRKEENAFLETRAPTCKGRREGFGTRSKEECGILHCKQTGNECFFWRAKLCGLFFSPPLLRPETGGHRRGRKKSGVKKEGEKKRRISLLFPPPIQQQQRVSLFF